VNVPTPVSSMVWVSVGSVIGSLGAVGLKSGAAHVKLEIRALLLNWRLSLGISLYLISTVFFLKGIAHGEISILFPLVSTSYIWSTIWAKVFFGESFTKEKFLGLGLILIGCVLLGFGRR
jgi:drug/metabolite transporter (DMT)-like permease